MIRPCQFVQQLAVRANGLVNELARTDGDTSRRWGVDGASMKTNGLALAAVAAALVTFAASAADAKVMIATYTGSISTGIDNAGRFAAVGTDMTGFSFTSRFIYDTSLGFRNDHATIQEVLGGSEVGFPGPSPLLDASVTVNSITMHFSGARSTQAAIDEGYSVTHIAWGPEANGGNLLQSVLFPVNAPTSLDTPFDASVPGGLSGGIIQVIGGPVPGDPSTILGLRVETVSVTAAVPEPATWGLMVLSLIHISEPTRPY